MHTSRQGCGRNSGGWQRNGNEHIWFGLTLFKVNTEFKGRSNVPRPRKAKYVQGGSWEREKVLSWKRSMLREEIPEFLLAELSFLPLGNRLPANCEQLSNKLLWREGYPALGNNETSSMFLLQLHFPNWLNVRNNCIHWHWRFDGTAV